MESGLKDGVCPKCAHTEIYFTESDTYKILPQVFSSLLRASARPPDRPNVDNLVCGNCGYAEFYVRPSSLEIVRKTWNRREST